jgi:hypothetical protein
VKLWAETKTNTEERSKMNNKMRLTHCKEALTRPGAGMPLTWPRRGMRLTWPGAGLSLAALCAAIVVCALGVTGCSESGGPGRDVVAEPEASGATTTAAAYVPTLAEIETRIELREPQVAALGAALEELKSQAGAIGGPRRGWKPPAQGGDAASIGPEAGDRPILRFIERSAQVLDPPQLVGLLTLLGERREQWRQGREDRMTADHRRPQSGRGGDRPAREIEQRLSELADLLGLSAEQREAVAAALREQREALRELRPGTSGEGRTPESMERRREIREAFEAKLTAILTPGQLEVLEAHRSEQREQRTAQRDARLEQFHERMIELLTNTLHLDAAQVEAVTRIQNEARDRTQAIHEAARTAQLPPADVRAQIEQVQAEARAAIAGVLTEEQRQVFEALLAWMPQPRHPGPGPRRG